MAQTVAGQIMHNHKSMFLVRDIRTVVTAPGEVPRFRITIMPLDISRLTNPYLSGYALMITERLSIPNAERP